MTTEPEKTTDTPAPPTSVETAIAPAPLPLTDATPPPASVEPLTPAWLVKADYFLLALVLILCFFLGSFTATNPDLWMHLAIGQQISDGTFQFGVDTFSWLTGPVGDQPAVFWVHHSWLYSWLVYQLNATVGGEGLILFKALLFTLAVGLLSRVGWSESNRWFILICVAMAAVAMSPRLTMQPIVFSILFLSSTLFLLDRASVFSYPGEGAPPDTRWLWGLPMVFALWANFDSWFILGPIVLGVCWAARGLATRFPGVSAVPGKTLGQVFAVGLLACLANPFHVRVFQLPPELAYIGVTLGQSIGLTLPDAIFAAGNTLRAFHRADAGQAVLLSTWSLSPLSPVYWNPSVGLNAAGLAYVPLMLLGLISFTLSAYVPAEKKAPTLHLGRFLLWLLLAVLALVLHRVIVFWAVLAAPLTAMTLGDFLTWQHKTSAVAFENRRKALQSARLLSVPFFLLLLFMAWPGWLHGSIEFSSPRRVAWGVHMDTSLERALESLSDIQPGDANPKLFNVSLGVGDAAPSAGPKVKHAVDSRLALFSRDAKLFLAARAALMDQNKSADAWQDVFAKYGVRHVALTNLTNERAIIRLQYLLSANDWRIRFGDNRHVVFSWAGADQVWPTNTVIADLNRQAFGKVALSHRPALDGASAALAPNWFTLYLEGVGSRPTGISESELLVSRYELARDLNSIAIAQGIGMLHTGPGARSAFAHALAISMHVNLLVQSDHGLAAIPVLAMRVARQAVAENPRDSAAYIGLVRAGEFLRENQEDAWTGLRSQLGSRHPSRLRNRIRQLTNVTAIHNAVQLEPDQLPYHHLLSRIYEQDQLYDSALKHLQIVGSLLPANLAKRNISPKERDANIQGFREMIAKNENDVMQRRAKFKEIEGEQDPLKKVNYALNMRYEELREKGRVQSPLGLGEKALEILEAIKPGDLDAEKRLAHLQIHFDLLLRLGRANAVADLLKDGNFKESLPALMYAEFRLQAAAATGDSTGAQEALDLIEKGFAEQYQKEREAAARVFINVVRTPLLSPILSSAMPGAPVAASELSRAYYGYAEQQNRIDSLRNELCNAITLRGILALEAGDTAPALVFFERALAVAGNDFGFSDQPLAQRYRDLLKSVR